MIINFKETKANKCYEDFVKHPENRKFRKAFIRQFNDITEAAVKLHNRLEKFTTAADYNLVWGQTDNRIELVRGVAQNATLVLKTRVTAAYRIFFYHCKNETEYTLMSEWQGGFSEIRTICIIEINKHDYHL